MFNIGDKIFCPSQGVGVVDVIEEKEFRGEMQKYYNIHLLNNSLKIMLPSSRLAISNIRLVSDQTTLDHVLNNVNDYATGEEELNSSNCKERIANNTTKLKSGTLEDYIGVITDLTHIKMNHTLNTSENQMLNSTRKVLIEEISLIKDISNNEASDLLDTSLSIV